MKTIKYTLLLSIFSLLSCFNQAFAYKVGLLFPTQEDARWYAEGKMVKQSLLKAGFQAELFYAGDGDSKLQDRQTKRMSDEGYDLMVVAAIDSHVLSKSLDAAKAKNIPVIAYDRLILDTDATDYYISIDNEMIGEMQGEFIVRQLTPGSGSVKYIELFCGDLADENAKVFFQGAMRKLKPYIDKGYIVVKSKQYDMKDIAIDNWDGELAKKRMESLIQTVGYGPNSERIDAILSPNDSIADGIIFTLKKYGYTKENMPIITGCDASPIATDHIKKGEMAMTIYKSDELALAVVDAVTAMSKGQEPDYNDDFSYNNGVKIMKSLLCDPELIDYSNVNKVAY